MSWEQWKLTWTLALTWQHLLWLLLVKHQVPSEFHWLALPGKCQ